MMANATLRIGPEYLFFGDRFVEYEQSDREWADPLGIPGLFGESNTPLPIKSVTFSDDRLEATAWNEPPSLSLERFAGSLVDVVLFDGERRLDRRAYVQVDITVGYPSMAQITALYESRPVDWGSPDPE